MPDPTADSREVLEPEIVTDDLPAELRAVHDLGAGPRRSTVGLSGPKGRRPGPKRREQPAAMEAGEPSELGLKMEEQFLLGEGDPYSGDPTLDSGPELNKNPHQREW